MDYAILYSSEVTGTSRAYGIKIEVASHPKVDLDTDNELQLAAYKAADLIEQALIRSMIARDPVSKAQAAAERADIVGLFEQPILVEEIPNGYCNRACCAHRPWFIVTTRVGRIKIGWRKRVIEIDWSDSTVELLAEELFPQQQVTKEGRSIHAWSLGDAKCYLNAILTKTPL